MKILLIWIILSAFLWRIKSQDGTFTGIAMIPDDGSQIGDMNQSAEIETKDPMENADSSPPFSCISCAYCERKGLEGGESWCPIKPGIQIGCISVYLELPGAAGGTDTFIIKNCISDLAPETLQYCEENEKMCRKCFGVKNCNEKHEIPLRGQAPPGITSFVFGIWSTCMISSLVMSV